jgi:integrase
MATIRKRYRDAGKTQFMGFQADYFDQHGKRHAKLFKLEREAKAFLKKVVPEVDQGVHTPARQSITIAKAAELWLLSCELNKLKTATLRQYRNHIRLHIAPALGNKKISELRRPDIEKLKDEWLAANVSRPMTTKLLASVKAILDEAMRTGNLAQNVARGVTVKRLTQDEPEAIKIGVSVPSKDEVVRILDAVRDTRWYPLIATAAFAGLRSSELRALRWVDIDFDAGEINVWRRADEKGKIDRPKSKAGTRAILLSDDLAGILRRWRLNCPRNAEGMVELVFPTGIGTVESHANIATRGFYAAQLRGGIVGATGRPRYGLHSLRHFYAWLIIGQNYNPKRVQQLLGHATLSMSFDRYGGLFAATQDEHAKMSEATKFLHATKEGG